MMEPRIIKTDEQYRTALNAVERLAALDPDPETEDGIRLELIAKLVEDYEKSVYRFDRLDPIAAIHHRMNEQGLRQKDIAPLLGGKNRASEILSGKRPLTLTMIRALSQKLGLSTDLLVREPSRNDDVAPSYDESDVPLELLKNRGWVEAGATVQELLQRLFVPSIGPVLLKHTRVYGANSTAHRARIQLWLARVRQLADTYSHVTSRFTPTSLSAETLGYVARLSWMEKGPRLAKEFLAERGIVVIIEPHLPATRVDGAALLGRDGTRVIGLTLREDRLDNFWFTLLHELVHAWKHLNSTDSQAIADENIEAASSNDDPIELEANELAADILIPSAKWKRSDAYLNPTTEAIQALAVELQVHPAVVAGRVRFERRKYSLFSRLVGYRQARAQFPEIRWT